MSGKEPDVHWLGEFLRENQNLALFACIAIGYAVGKIRVGGISLGGICGTLVVALFVGQSGVVLDDEVKSLAFAMFIFTLGYLGGPQFFANLNRKSLRYFLFTGIEVVCVVAVAFTSAKLLGLDKGTAAGLLAGGATESAAVGTATEAIGKLGLPAAETTTLQNNVATAYTISYLVGLITIVLLTSQIAPRIMRIDLRVEADKLWKKLGGRDESGAAALPELVGRLHIVEQAAGKSVRDVETALGEAVAVEQVERDNELLDVAPDLVLQANDAVLLVGRRGSVLNGDVVIGPERSAADGIGMRLASEKVLLGKSSYNNQTIGELRKELRADGHQTVFIDDVSRMDNPMPVRDGAELKTGDVLTLTGAPKDVKTWAQKLGSIINTGVAADFIYISIGIIAGILIGMLSVKIAGVPFSLGTGGGCLLSGLFFGWLRAKHPTVGQYNPAAAGVIKELGLVIFIAATGLAAGPQAISLIQKFGWGLPIASLLVTLVPAMISLVVGWKILKLDKPILLGCVAGQQCSTPAITAIQGVAGNSTPLIGYTVVYALSNVALPLLGPLIVAIA